MTWGSTEKCPARARARILLGVVRPKGTGDRWCFSEVRDMTVTSTVTWRDGGTDLFSARELRALDHEGPGIESIRSFVRTGEMMWPDGPTQVRKRIIASYVRKARRRSAARLRYIP